MSESQNRAPSPKSAPAFSSDADRWKAVVERNPSADGHFVYTVVTTGIVCRPQCASRVPKRENVRFFDTLPKAVDAGFRPCKRCQPDAQPPKVEIAARIARACRLLEATQPSPTLQQLAASAAMSPFHFHRVFKAHVGVTPRQYAAAHRAKKFSETLPVAGSVTEAIYEAGYSSSSRAYENASANLGMRPAELRLNGAGLRIAYATRETTLGWVLIAATTKGVCALLLGEKPADLEADLRFRFRNATLVQEPRTVTRFFDLLNAYLEAPDRSTRLATTMPLDPQGTAFQLRVWQALRQIPPGTTQTYGGLAAASGLDSRHTRAVATACAANAIAIAIPCHRVIRNNGSLAGYRWGVKRKEALLAAERPSKPKP